MLGQPAALDVAADAIPPEGSFIVPQAFKGTAVEGLFRRWCADGEFTQAEATEVSAALNTLDKEGADIGQWPAHLRQKRLELLEAGFMATPEGQQTLARARAVFAEIRRSHPDLAGLLDAAGATSDPGVVRALARLARG
jgi:hypothetical protein